MYQKMLSEMKSWAEQEASIQAVIYVGSYARGTNRSDSDLDVVVITEKKAEMVVEPEFVKLFGAVVKQQIEYYGACTSIRVWYADGREVEFGMVEPSWMDQPLDAGTEHVLLDGYKIILDKKGYFVDIPVLIP